MNDQNAQSCTFCGYLFENYGTGTVNNSSSFPSTQPSSSELNTVPDSTIQNSSSSTPFSSTSGTTPLYVVSKSILGTIIPSLVYLVLITAVGLFSSFNLYSIVLVLFFVLVAVVPALMSPRRFEFYDSSLKVHKTIGGDSEYQYSDISIVDYPGRRGNQQIVLSVSGARRPLVISKNPTNQQLGLDLKTFLTSKLKKPVTPENPANPNSENQDPDLSGAGSSAPPL